MKLNDEDEAISQYTISGPEVGADAVVFQLGSKHTDCLAKERCGASAPTKPSGEVPGADVGSAGSKTVCCGS